MSTSTKSARARTTTNGTAKSNSTAQPSYTPDVIAGRVKIADDLTSEDHSTDDKYLPGVKVTWSPADRYAFLTEGAEGDTFHASIMLEDPHFVLRGTTEQAVAGELATDLRQAADEMRRLARWFDILAEEYHAKAERK